MKKQTKKTKILAVGDIHGDEKFVERLAKKAKNENVDLVILAGDLTFLGRPVKNIIKPFVKEKKEVILIPGNHETMSTINTLTNIYERTRHVHGYSVVKGDIGIFGSGYEPSTGPFSIEDEEIFKILKKGNDKIKDLKKKIMVTHAHPKGSIAEFSGFPGSGAVKKAIKEFKPDVLISAHIHEAGGLQEKIGKTKVIHVGRKPKIFEM